MSPVARRSVYCLVVVLTTPSLVQASPARERAIEQIPELMGRILESQEEIRERDDEMSPLIEGYNRQIAEAKRSIDAAPSEEGAAAALVDYVEAYAARLEAQESGLRGIESSVVRMRADARDLIRATQVAQTGGEGTREERRDFFGGQFQGIASAMATLGERLDRQEDASTAGAVLHASWASHGALELPVQEIGPEGALAFARKVEGLYARYQARSRQLAGERRSVRRLLDMLIERQLAQQLDALFAGSEGVGLGSLLSGAGRSLDWQDLGAVVSRALGLPSGSVEGMERGNRAALDRLDYFARGGHRP